MPTHDSLDSSGFDSFVNSGFDSFNKVVPELGRGILVIRGPNYTWESYANFGTFDPVTRAASQVKFWFDHDDRDDDEPKVEYVHEIGLIDVADTFSGHIADYSMILWLYPRNLVPFTNELLSWPGVIVLGASRPWEANPSYTGVILLPELSVGINNVLGLFTSNGSVSYAGDDPYDFPRRILSDYSRTSRIDQGLTRDFRAFSAPGWPELWSDRYMIRGARQIVNGGIVIATTAEISSQGFDVYPSLIGLPSIAHFPVDEDGPGPEIIAFGSEGMIALYPNNQTFMINIWRYAASL